MTVTNNLDAPDSIWDARTKTQPIEVWLSQPNLEVACRIVYEDERTDSLGVESLSMRGAQREVTGFLIERGYTPAGRWEIERLLEGHREGVAAEASRRFKPGTAAVTESEEDVEGPGGHRSDVITDSVGFYVYENWTNTFALIHRGSCSFCNDGQGAQGRGSKTPNGQWHGTFLTMDDAINAAREVAARHSNSSVWSVRPCGICLRGASRRSP
jgi:hypothetical protein